MLLVLPGKNHHRVLPGLPQKIELRGLSVHLPVPEAEEGGGGAGRPRPTAIVFGGVSFERDLNDLHLLWTV